MILYLFYNWTKFSVSVLFSNSVVPLLRESVGILMQRIPTGLEKNLHIGYQRVRK